MSRAFLVDSGTVLEDTLDCSADMCKDPDIGLKETMDCTVETNLLVCYPWYQGV